MRGLLTGAAGIGNDGVRVKAKEKKWSRKRESYLTDDSDPLPLRITYLDSSTVSPVEIEKRLQCDPDVQEMDMNKAFDVLGDGYE